MKPHDAPDQRPLIYFDDITVGQRFRTREYTITEDEIITYAKQFDPQPFHIDPVAAKESWFGGLTASGWHVIALSMRLLLDGGPRFAGGVVGGGMEVKWLVPLRPGDTIHVECVMTSAEPSKSKPDRGIIIAVNETHNQHGEVIATATGTAIVPRRPIEA